jgi:predicted DNA-binding protein (MmcQ/YjbR family)
VAPDVTTRLQEFALGLPGAWEDMPWEDDVVAKVGKKIFVFFGPATISVKLPVSGPEALGVPGAMPTSYGLGRHGWVTVPTKGRGAPTRGVLEDWVEESFRTIAPKKQVAELDAR